MKKFLTIVLSLFIAVGCFGGCKKDDDSKATEGGVFSDKLTEYKLSGLTDLEVKDFEKVGAVQLQKSGKQVSFSTSARTVSHGNIYTAYVSAAIKGDIKKGETIVVGFSAKNTGSTNSTNFLVDLYNKGGEANKVRDTWLTRNPIFTPNKEAFTQYYFYGIAKENTDQANFEINLGFSEQAITVENVQAAKYSGTLRESVLENLPYMSRNNKSGANAWHDFYAADSAWRTTSDKMISDNRTGSIKVNVTDSSGNAVNGASVKVDMLEHDYYFGSSSGASNYLGENAQTNLDKMKEFFNIITFGNDLKWEFAKGKSESAKEALKFVSDGGMKVHGHVLFWPGTDSDPYDDGVDNIAEYVVTPPFIVATVRVIQAMQKMQKIETSYGYLGYGDGKIASLKTEINNALEVFEKEKTRTDGKKVTDELSLEQINQMTTACQSVLDKITLLQDEAITFDGLDADVTNFQSILRKAVIDHVKDVAQYYADTGAIVEWDVINEAMNMGYRGVVSALGEDAYLKDKTKICQDQIFVDVLKAAREGAGEGVKLSYNDTSWQSNGQQRADTFNFFKYLKDKNAPLDFFGLQAYIYPQSIKAHVDPATLWSEFDKLASLNVQTEITEYSMSGWNDVFATAEQLNMLNADFTTDYIRTNFAHSSSIGFIGWGGLPTNGPNASAWYKLAYNEFWTNEIASTTNGLASVNGYLGKYKITVTANGKTKTVEVNHLNAKAGGKETVVNIQLA